MKVFLTVIAMATFTVAANLLLKIGVSSGASGQPLLAHLFNWRVLLGLSSFGVAALFYALLMRWVPLNVATSFASAQYVAVIVASAVILAEPIERAQVLGITLIAAGIAVIGWSRF